MMAKQREDLFNDLPELPPPEESDLRKAERRLEDAFKPMRVRCAWVEAPFGLVFLARSERGVCLVTFRKKEDDLLDSLERRGLLPTMAPAELDHERRELGEYFGGRRKQFELPIDLRWGTDFQHQVLRAASAIPFGEVWTYSDVAGRIRRPKAQRAVGNALGKNPVPILIPCHRVIAAGGRLGGYTGGVDIKRTLMSIEGIRLA